MAAVISLDRKNESQSVRIFCNFLMIYSVAGVLPNFAIAITEAAILEVQA